MKSLKRIIHPLLVIVFYSLWYVILFSPVLFSGKLLAPGDGIIQYVPAFYARKLWEPLIQCGFPIAADPQSMTWYPLFLLFSLFGSWNGFVISAFVLASSFVYGYVHSLTGMKLPAIFGGLVFGMTGFMISHLGHTTIIHGAAWMPALIWALEKLHNKFSGSWFILGCVALACSTLAGHIQITLYALGLSALYTLFRAPDAKIGRLRYYGLFLSIVCLGFALAAIQLFTSIELAQRGTRTSADFPFFVSFSLPLYQSLTFLFPYLFGSPQLGPYGHMFGLPLITPYGLPYFGDWNMTELGLYLGLFPILLAVLSLLAKTRCRLTWFWSAIAVLAFLLMLGDETPLARLLFQIPVYNKFRSPSRHAVELALAISILSAFALSGIQRQLIPVRTVLKSCGFGILILLLASLGIHYPEKIHTIAAKKGLYNLAFLPWSNSAVGIPLVTFVLVTASLVWWMRRMSSFYRRSLMVLALIIDLGTFIWFRDWRLGSPLLSILESKNLTQRYERMLRQNHQRMASVASVNGSLSGLPPNILRVWNVPSLNGYGAMILARFSELLSMNPDGSLYGMWFSPRDRSLDITSVRYVFVRKNELHPTNPSSAFAPLPENLKNGRRWRHVEDVDDISVYENRRAMPLTWLVREVWSDTPANIRKIITSSRLPDGRKFHPSKIALVEEPLIFDVNSQTETTAKIVNQSDTQLEVHTNSESDAFLVLSESYYPGWLATVDGYPAYIYKTNYIQRGVFLQAGKHVVQFDYRPESLFLGLISTIAGSLVILGLVLFARYRDVSQESGYEM